MSVINSGYSGASPASLHSQEEAPTADNASTVDASQADQAQTDTEAAGSTQAQAVSDTELAILNKRLADKDAFIKQLIDERKADREAAKPVPPSKAEPDVLTTLRNVGFPVDELVTVIRDQARAEAKAEVAAEVGPEKAAKAADLYMVQNHPEYAKNIQNGAILKFLEANPSVNAEVMELVEAGQHKAARLTAWGEFTARGGRATSSAAADAAQAERDAAKKNAGILNTSTGKREAEKKDEPRERIAKARMHYERTGDRRPLMVETAKALHGDTIKQLAAQPR